MLLTERVLHCPKWTTGPQILNTADTPNSDMISTLINTFKYLFVLEYRLVEQKFNGRGVLIGAGQTRGPETLGVNTASSFCEEPT
jgi:hypothetical protein